MPGLQNALHLSDKWDNVQGYSYYGSGVNNGQCGVTIKQVKASNHGLIKCFLGTTEGNELKDEIPLTVAREYQQIIAVIVGR